MISICLLTRERPEVFKNMCLSARNMAKNRDNIEFVVYRDSDDLTEYEYFGNHKVITKERGRFSPALINECQKIATGPIYMFIADDFIFGSEGWDEEVEETFEIYEDKLVLVCPDNTDWNRWHFGVTGFLHKNWIDTVGYFMPEYEGAQGIDRWVNDLAKAIRRQVRLYSVSVNHINYKDDVHFKKNRIGRREQWSKNYDSEELVERRKHDAELLKKAMR